MRTFRLVLANTLVQSIVNLTAWFVLIFRALLETRSVFVTGVIGGGGSARCSASALR
jgi:DHA3 family multidrug efflux protein-like MFS transporter